MWPIVGNMYICLHAYPDCGKVLWQKEEKIKETLGYIAKTWIGNVYNAWSIGKCNI